MKVSLKRITGSIALSAIGIFIAFILTKIFLEKYGLPLGGLVILFYFSCIQNKFTEDIFLLIIPVTAFIFIFSLNQLFMVTTPDNTESISLVLSVRWLQIFVSFFVFIVLYGSRFFNLCSFFKKIRQ